MRVLSRFVLLLVAMASVATVTAAHADPLDPDFKMHVLDPTYIPPGGPDYIPGLTFQITFAACAPNELPNGITAQGCFLGFNRSDYDWTSLQFTFLNNAALNRQAPNCALEGQDDIFSTTHCTLGTDYVLDFATGVIPNSGSASTFFITEDGVDPALFGTGQAVVTSYTGTPEPASFVLLGTGLLLLAGFATYRPA